MVRTQATNDASPTFAEILVDATTDQPGFTYSSPTDGVLLPVTDCTSHIYYKQCFEWSTIFGTQTTSSSSSTCYTVTITQAPTYYGYLAYIPVTAGSRIGGLYQSANCSLYPGSPLTSASCQITRSYESTSSTTVITANTPFALTPLPINGDVGALATPWSVCVPTATSTNSESPPTVRESLSTGAKAGIGVGSGAVVCLFIALGILIWQRRRQKQRQKADASVAPQTEQESPIEKPMLDSKPLVELEDVTTMVELPRGDEAQELPGTVGKAAQELPANETQELPGDEAAAELGRDASTKGKPAGIELRHEMRAVTTPQEEKSKVLGKEDVARK